ncbi:MAG: Nicotinate phosphoribosyltransferase [Burkholderia sp.]|jgi:nicotinate phosphoribosyltransferase
MIIESLLDTDLYKFTMQQCVLHQFPGASVKYRFKCRTPGINLRPFVKEINDEVDHLCTLYLTESELSYLGSLRFIKPDFVDFLSLLHLKRKYVNVKASDDYPCGIDITVEGPWLHTILFEIPLLEIVSEVYFRRTYPDLSWEEGDRRLAEKIRMLREEPTDGDLFISDFGSRRRFSKAWHEHMLREVKKGLGPMFTGTSNVMFAQKLGLIPHGTMAHEYLQAFQSLGPRLRDSQRYAFEMWAKEYRGDLGIALSDVYGIEPFLKDFDMYFCKLFDGVRHDSGDPMVWGERMIEHWKKNRCDPRSKTLVFSDALNIPRVIELYRHYHRRCRVAFGVGTNLTNDLGPEPLNIVLKMIEADGQPVAKISDTPEKGMCEDESYLNYLRHVFGMDKAPAK